MADSDNIDSILLKHGKGKQDELMAILQDVQASLGYLPDWAIYRIAEFVGITPSKVYGVATFYNRFRLTPTGKHLIRVCHGTACHVNGSEEISTALSDELKLKEGESTTKDGKFTLETVACLGCCSLAPCMMINDSDVYGRLTSSESKKIVRGLK